MEFQPSFSRLKSRLIDWSDVPLRLILSATFMAHGYSKLYGGVDSFAAALGQMGVPLPVLSAWLVTFVELFGGLFLLVGFLTRFSALAIGINMVMAIFLVHIGQGFMMKAGAPGSPGPAGYEWQLALVAMCTTLVMRGAGSLSVDHYLRHRRTDRRSLNAEYEQRVGTASKISAGAPAPVRVPEPEKPRVAKP
jgi:putative oxidoreductase